MGEVARGQWIIDCLVVSRLVELERNLAAVVHQHRRSWVGLEGFVGADADQLIERIVLVVDDQDFVVVAKLGNVDEPIAVVPRVIRADSRIVSHLEKNEITFAVVERYVWWIGRWGTARQ